MAIPFNVDIGGFNDLHSGFCHFRTDPVAGKKSKTMSHEEETALK
jgi:hypothetical protein